MVMLMKIRSLNRILVMSWLLVTPMLLAQETKERLPELKTKIEQLIKNLGADDWQKSPPTPLFQRGEEAGSNLP